MSRANFRIARETPGFIVIQDIGPWDQNPSVTNDAEAVVADLAPILNGRRLYYNDSDGRCDELLVRDGVFDGFAFGGPGE